MITMAKRIKTAVTKNSCNYYIIDDFTNPSTKKRSTFVYERLGNIVKKNRFEAENDEDDILLTSVFDVIIYTAEHAREDELITIREYHATFNYHFYTDLDIFVEKLEKKIKVYEKNMIIQSLN